MNNRTARVIEELMKMEKTPMHLEVIAEKIGKTRVCCYSAIHKEIGTTFQQTGKATYFLKNV